jgi:hypothetical protein
MTLHAKADTPPLSAMIGFVPDDSIVTEPPTTLPLKKCRLWEAATAIFTDMGVRVEETESMAEANNLWPRKALSRLKDETASTGPLTPNLYALCIAQSVSASNIRLIEM